MDFVQRKNSENKRYLEKYNVELLGTKIESIKSLKHIPIINKNPKHNIRYKKTRPTLSFLRIILLSTKFVSIIINQSPSSLI